MAEGTPKQVAVPAYVAPWVSNPALSPVLLSSNASQGVVHALESILLGPTNQPTPIATTILPSRNVSPSTENSSPYLSLGLSLSSAPLWLTLLLAQPPYSYGYPDSPAPTTSKSTTTTTSTTSTTPPPSIFYPWLLFPAPFPQSPVLCNVNCAGVWDPICSVNGAGFLYNFANLCGLNAENCVTGAGISYG